MSLVPKIIDKEDNKLLEMDITKEEIRGAISALSNDKSPSPDGFPVQFYKESIGWFVDDLYSLYIEAIIKGSLGKNVNQGLIKLIPKGGDKTLIKNWRPITLLNVSYKILVKLVARRLKKILPKIVSSTQTRFVKGRYILENLVTCWESLHWAKESRQSGAMLLINVEKAYDRIEWDYIIKMLHSLGFPPDFCNMVRTLLCDANVVVEVNGLRSSNFELTRSIRHGCPLAHALFMLATNAMFYLLKDSFVTPTIKGITLPNKEEVCNIQFIDDTTLLIKLEEENLTALMKNIDIICLASGSKVALHKSNLLGWDDNPLGWLTKFLLNRLGPTQIVKYLGIPFSVLPNLK